MANDHNIQPQLNNGWPMGRTRWMWEKMFPTAYPPKTPEQPEASPSDRTAKVSRAASRIANYIGVQFLQADPNAASWVKDSVVNEQQLHTHDESSDLDNLKRKYGNTSAYYLKALLKLPNAHEPFDPQQVDGNPHEEYSIRIDPETGKPVD